MEELGVLLVQALGLIIGNWFVINIYYHKVIGIDILAFAKEILSMTLPIANSYGYWSNYKLFYRYNKHYNIDDKNDCIYMFYTPC